MGRLEGKKALITGGARGIGAAIAAMFVKEGAIVAITDQDEEGAAKLAADINKTDPDKAFAYGHNVTDEAAWRKILASASADMGGLNILVNNAGIAHTADIEEESFEGWRRMMSIDLDSVFLGSKHALAYMRPHGLGSIINLSSIAGLIASHNHPAYNAAKAGVWMLTKSVALHCARTAPAIRCNSLHPTFIKTPLLEPMAAKFGSVGAVHEKLARQIPMGHLGEPDDVAYAALFLASDESKFITGSEIKIDGGVSAL